MSQQMEQNERPYQQQAAYDDGYQGGYHDPFAPNAPAQKVGMTFQTATRTTASAGQRLALAIVSVAVLGGLAISLFSSTNLIVAGNIAMLMGLLVVLVVGIVLAIINLVFNRR
jgi:dethiobiotin synthetase